MNDLKKGLTTLLELCQEPLDELELSITNKPAGTDQKFKLKRVKDGFELADIPNQASIKLTEDGQKIEFQNNRYQKPTQFPVTSLKEHWDYIVLLWKLLPKLDDQNLKNVSKYLLATINKEEIEPNEKKFLEKLPNSGYQLDPTIVPQSQEEQETIMSILENVSKDRQKHLYVVCHTILQLSNDHLERETYYWALAKFASQRSFEEVYKVGCCYFDNNTKQLLGCSYNGFPRGFNDPAREKNDDTKHDIVVHSETNAACFANTHNLNEANAIVTLFPCSDCAKFVNQKGITEVFYETWKPKFWQSAVILSCAGIGFRQLCPWLKMNYPSINYSIVSAPPKNWEEYFMGIALLAKKRSSVTEKEREGCCLVSRQNILLSVGYTGNPRSVETRKRKNDEESGPPTKKQKGAGGNSWDVECSFENENAMRC
eukprot:TRINITY_DN288_c0_g1_i2.p1 TRINITY_DN288_c0_g1~~TRINITY_DN288_c0_g1_i2.p1  ORF type:complete len:428 (-),score=-5.87 TRINITY_DN288_c0_g1_i2:535-1818(-)